MFYSVRKKIFSVLLLVSMSVVQGSAASVPLTDTQLHAVLGIVTNFILSDVDSDGDGVPDSVDTDDDGDGVLDANDAFPLDPTESIDTDGDGIGNNADTDDDGDGVSDADEVATGSNPLDVNSIAFNGYAYNILTSAHTSRQWLDRNLGATMVCSKSRDDAAAPYADDAAYVADQKDCFGGYFQWGRKYNGHEASDSDTSPDMIAEDTETNGEFIVGHDQWSTVVDDVLWSGVDAVNNVCPAGFRVPTIDEIQDETIRLSGEDNVTNRDKAFKSFLKLPSAGERDSDGNIRISYGVLHGSTVNGEGYVSYFYYDQMDTDINFYPIRASAISVRCIKDINIADTTAPTAEISMPATEAPVDQNITVFFSEPMDRDTLISSNFSLVKDPDGAHVAADVILTETGIRVILNPTTDLFYGTGYKLTISNVKDVAGNEMASYEYSFTTTAGAFIFKGKGYKRVTSPYTHKVWLDRNLGASRVCTAFDDAVCYGDYYQWGRNADGHEAPGSTATATQATQIDPVQATVDGKFISADDTNDYDWAQAADSNGSIRQTNWSKIDGSSVCPTGFRVPTIDELDAELFDMGSADIGNREDAFDSFLALPSAGGRSQSGASMFGIGSWGQVWASSAHGIYSRGAFFYDSDSDNGATYRAVGMSVRCLRD